MEKKIKNKKKNDRNRDNARLDNAILVNTGSKIWSP